MRTTPFLASLVALMLGAMPTGAFSLLGPMAGWQAPDLGYNIPDSVPEYGGPRLRGDEYRLSTPVVTYGIDGSFVEFFGADGVRAVDEAFAVFNSLTNVSAFSESLSEFPLKADGINPTAAALGLLDLKTQLMSQIMANLGLTSPERWCWSIRGRAGDPIRYSVVNYNFDPVSGRPSRYINGTLYSYVLRDIFNESGARIFSDAREIPVDSANPNVSLASFVSVASFATSDERVSRAIDPIGRYFTGLTRDDAGGMRYLYHPLNRNYEQAPVGSVRGSVASAGGGGGGFGLPRVTVDHRVGWANRWNHRRRDSCHHHDQHPSVGQPGGASRCRSGAFRAGQRRSGATPKRPTGCRDLSGSRQLKWRGHPAGGEPRPCSS